MVLVGRRLRVPSFPSDRRIVHRQLPCLDGPVHKAFVFSFYVNIYIYILWEYALDKAKKIRWLTKEKCLHHVISRILHPSTLLLHLPSMILCLFLAEASLIPLPLTVFLPSVSLLRWHIPRRTDSIIRIHQHQRYPPMMPWLCRIFQPERLSSTFHGVGKSNQPSLWES